MPYIGPTLTSSHSSLCLACVCMKECMNSSNDSFPFPSDPSPLPPRLCLDRYAFRQLVFYLSQLPVDGQEAALARMATGPTAASKVHAHCTALFLEGLHASVAAVKAGSTASSGPEPPLAWVSGPKDSFFPS